MLKTLRRRLFASYIIIIMVILLVLVTGIFYQTSNRAQRTLKIGAELSFISPAVNTHAQYTLAASDNRRELEKSLDHLAKQANVRMLIFSGIDGQVLYDSESDWHGISINSDLISQSLNSIARYIDGNDTQWLWHTSESTIAPNTYLALVKEDPKAFKYFSEAFAGPLVRSTVVAAVLAAVLSGMISQSVANPLRRMAKAANAVADGNYEQTLEPEGPREVQTVAHNFNHMAQQVKASQQAQRDFVANVSHDLKTPLTSIQGWSQALLDGTIDDEETRRNAAEIIHSEAERMQRMVSQLLDLARLESGQFQLSRKSVDVVAILRSIKDNLELSAESRNIALTLSADTAPIISADPDRLTQIFTNLVSNALAHCDTGDTIEMIVSAETDHAIIAIRDTGAGISEKDIGRIFERFYQVDKSRTRSADRQGTGLGLAITRELVLAHDGEISAESQLDHGATFTVRLPSA